MTEEVEKRQRTRKRLWIILGVIAVLLAALLVPPMISINRYKGQITQLVSSSLGRPVRLSGVEFRLLPWPGFVLSNLVVEGDPAFGAEPVLHADSVTASVRFLPLWRGRLEISTISVDNASLNLVRMPGGKWNLDSLFRTAAAKAGATSKTTQRNAPRLPYLEATNSRINFKNGVEKLPFSLLNTDFSFWQEAPGEWHIRLRGQPARTDVSLYQEDTGVVRLEASLRNAPALREMPLRVDLDWREAQLGQLSRLIIGSDPGWRGNLTANLHVDGTADTAHVTARLRAAGVHRAEFAPAEPLDFDANCGFVFHYPHRSVENLACNSPLGNGRLQLTGDIPGGDSQPTLTLALDKVPIDAGLAFLRTIRSGVDPGLSASGDISGKLTYAGRAPEPVQPRRLEKRRHAEPLAAPPPPLTGTFTVTGFQLSGGGLNDPLKAARVVFEPENVGPTGTLAFTATAEVPAGGPSPLSFSPRVTLHGYELNVHGSASLARARQFTSLAGIANPAELATLTGGPISLALNIQGPWLHGEEPKPVSSDLVNPSRPLPDVLDPGQPEKPSIDGLSGTVTLHDAYWKPDYLAHRVAISQAVLHLGGSAPRWDPIDFSYGPVKATASLTPPDACVPQKPCPAHFQLQFAHLKAAELQGAILGARAHVSLFDSLVDKLHLSSAPAWPSLDGEVRAASLTLGPVTLDDPTAQLEINSTGAKISNLQARILGGKMDADGIFTKPDTDQGRPAYALHATFTKLSARDVGKLLGMRFSGGALNASGNIDLSGVTARELASSAKGTLHFNWPRGAIAALPQPPSHSKTKKTSEAASRTSVKVSTEPPAETPAESPSETSDQPKPTPVPPQLAHFARLTGDAEIAKGKVTLNHAEVVRGARRRPVEAELTLGEPANLTFTPPKESLAAKAQASQP